MREAVETAEVRRGMKGRALERVDEAYSAFAPDRLLAMVLLLLKGRLDEVKDDMLESVGWRGVD